MLIVGRPLLSPAMAWLLNDPEGELFELDFVDMPKLGASPQLLR